MKVLLGTTNPSKIRMFEEFFVGCDVEFLTLRDLNITDEPCETGSDPAENAAIKAAFYGQFADHVICNDSGLYFDELAMDDPRQPGLHIRTPQGKRLDDEEMIAYYGSLVHSLGGKVIGRYPSGFAVKTPSGVVSYLQKPKDVHPFIMTDTPCEKRRPGWPLDSLSKEMDGTYFLEKAAVLPKLAQPTTEEKQEKEWVRFMKNALGMLEA